MTLPRAILIDLDDTLLDDSRQAGPCWRDACAQFAGRIEIAAGDLRTAIREQASWFWSDPDRHRSGRLDPRATTHLIVERALAGFGVTNGDLARDLAYTYRDLRDERAALFPGAAEALEKLRRDGVRLGMMTNGAADAQRAKIERFGLAPHFDHIIVEGEFGAGKPDRRVFETLLDALKAEPSDAWTIGDNLEFDVLAPMRLGLHGIWVDAAGAGADGREEKPHRIVRAFTAIADPPGSQA